MRSMRTMKFACAFAGAAGVALVLALAVPRARAYTFDGNNLAANSGRPKWASFPVTYRFNQNVSDAKANIVDGSNPRAAVNAAFAEWSSESAANFTLGADSAVQNAGVNDGVNLITFEQTAANTAIHGGAGGPLAVCVFFRNGSNQITDADIVFNHTYTFSTLGGAGHYPIEPIATHEIGHFQGLEHSAILAATMWPYLGVNGVVTESELMPNSITHDDRAGVNQLYPQGVFQTAVGGVSGLVTRSGTNVYGAHVVAVNLADGICHGASITLGSNQGANYGRYSIQGLRPGNYHVYAEPMDGPTTSGNWSGNFAGGDHWGGAFTGTYQTTYFPNNTSPTTVVVTAGSTQTANIAVVASAPTVNPQLLAFCPDGTSFPGSGALALDMDPGDIRWVAVIGDGISGIPVANITCSDPAITLTFAGGSSGSVGPYTYRIFQVAVPGGAPGGGRNLIFKTAGGETAIFTGAINVNAAEVLPPPINFVREPQLFE